MAASGWKAWPGMLKLADKALVAVPAVANPAAAIASQASTTASLCRRTTPVSRITGRPPQAHRRRAEPGRLPGWREPAYNERSVHSNSHGEVTQKMPEGKAAAPEPDTVQLMEQFRAIAHASHNRTNARMSAAGLSLARFRVLQALASGGRLRMNELSTALGVVPRTVTTIIDALEK